MNSAHSIAEAYAADAEQRRRWYSPAAEAYNAVRPKYPDDIIAFAVDCAKLVPKSSLLEIGCGPGTATTAFASRGFSMVGVEPNDDFIAIAQRNCAAYPNVTLQHCTFEECVVEPTFFDGVVAASAMHWVSADMAYKKSANALASDGHLILLWNMVLQPSDEINRRLLPTYRSRVPDLIRPETDNPETQQLHLTRFGQNVLGSGYFTDLIFHSQVVAVRYSADDYIQLLSTYSQYLALDVATRDGLFADIKQAIADDFGGSLDLTYRSACHVARKA